MGTSAPGGIWCDTGFPYRWDTHYCRNNFLQTAAVLQHCPEEQPPFYHQAQWRHLLRDLKNKHGQTEMNGNLRKMQDEK